ncbi:M48 family metallopeptidase [Roseateles sp. P5_E11]
MSASTFITGRWFDGQCGMAQPVEVSLHNGALRFGDRATPLDQVQWPERMRHGQRQILLRGAGVISFPDAAAFDAWADSVGQLPGLVARWQLSWHLALMSLGLLTVLLAAGWRWGLPWASDRLVERVPLSAEQPIGEQAMALIDRQMVRPTQLSEAEQQAWRQRFERMLTTARATGMRDLPEHWQLHFRRTTPALGPNAFALPGEQMCVTDELLELLKDEPDAVLSILAHEAGHVRHRHGLRMGLRAGVTAAVTALWLGDYSSLLNGLPLALVTKGYSRDYEREADAFARELARRGGVDPARIAVFFERIREKYGGAESPLAIAFSSHPGDSERIAFFKAEGPAAPKN